MHRVYVAWDAEEARRFLRFLKSHGMTGQMIEDRSFPTRDEGVHDTEGAPEVWISDASLLPRATELAQLFEQQRKAPAEPVEPADADDAGPTKDASAPDATPNAGAKPAKESGTPDGAT
jgi:hypothetical protein